MPNAKTSPMKPSMAACITPKGSLSPPGLACSERPMRCPTEVAPMTTTNRINQTTRVLSWKKNGTQPLHPGRRAPCSRRVNRYDHASPSSHWYDAPAAPLRERDRCEPDQVVSAQPPTSPVEACDAACP